MNALSRTYTVKGAEKADELFDELRRLHEVEGGSRYQPIIQTYVVLLHAWARCKSPFALDNVESILKDLLEDESVQPNARAFAAVLTAWSRSGQPNKAERAVKLLQQMKELAKTNPQVAPNLFAYNRALQCCERTRGTNEEQMKALKLAFAIHKSMRLDKNSAPPNWETYGTLLRAAGFLLPAGPERSSVASAVFEQAKQARQVNRQVLVALKSAADLEVLVKLLAPLVDPDTGYFDFDKIPPSWSQNVEG